MLGDELGYSPQKGAIFSPNKFDVRGSVAVQNGCMYQITIRCLRVTEYEYGCGGRYVVWVMSMEDVFAHI